MAEWNIERTSRVCVGCNSQFDEGDEFNSALYETDESFERRDYCDDCWPPAEEPFSFWKSSVPESNKPPKRLVDDQVLLDVWLKLADAREEKKRDFRYILTLILVRKRILKLGDFERVEGMEYMNVRCPRLDNSYRVAAPDLTDEQIAQLQRELVVILNMDALADQIDDELDGQDDEPTDGEPSDEAPAADDHEGETS